MTALTHPEPTPEPINLWIVLPPVCAGCEGPLAGAGYRAIADFPGDLTVTVNLCGDCFGRLGRDLALGKRLTEKGRQFVKLYTEPAQGCA